MARATLTLDANRAIDATMLSGAGNPQDVVELVLRDCPARSRRTETRTGDAADGHRPTSDRPTARQG
ncbi:DUF2191 domain-containing protein [Kitasatospora sp. NPDC048545]|uniref:DUF2191 domain-containing protein n=1 Tax=Kitasatospora sp. NPDC048545 TaxID=3157208 RepID=UPI00340ACC86